MNLGLFLCWSISGPEEAAYTKRVNDMNFYRRLEFLREKVVRKFDDSSSVLSAYNHWIDEANEWRELRNEFFHGRWGIDVGNQRAANVVGLPRTASQKSRLFSIEELQNMQKSIRKLISRLHKLGETNPV